MMAYLLMQICITQSRLVNIKYTWMIEYSSPMCFDSYITAAKFWVMVKWMAHGNEIKSIWFISSHWHQPKISYLKLQAFVGLQWVGTCCQAITKISITTPEYQRNIKMSLHTFIYFQGCLTHWGRVTHICLSKLTIISSDNGLSPGRRQAIIWTNAGKLLFGPPGTNFSEILIEIHTFSFKKMHLKI